MITCKNCNAFASAESINYNAFTAQVGKLTIKPCKKCGGDEGDYGDFEEIDQMFGLESYPPYGRPDKSKVEVLGSEG